jgi:hypothetical protein
MNFIESFLISTKVRTIDLITTQQHHSKLIREP